MPLHFTRQLRGKTGMLKNYDNFFLPAADLEKGREFYQQVLGLAVKFYFSAHGLLAFRVGDEEPAIILRSHPGVKPSILFEVYDARATHAELNANDVHVLSEPYGR